jgi:hypothetical protein
LDDVRICPGHEVNAPVGYGAAAGLISHNELHFEEENGKDVTSATQSLKNCSQIKQLRCQSPSAKTDKRPTFNATSWHERL